MIEEIIKLLDGKKARESMSECWQNFVGMGYYAIDNPEECGGVDDCELAIDFASDASGYPWRPLELMWQEVKKKTPLPQIITYSELYDTWLSLLPCDQRTLEDSYEPDDCYPAFLNYVRSLLRHRESKPFAIAKLPIRDENERLNEVAMAYQAGISKASASEFDESIDEEVRQVILKLVQGNEFEIWSANGITVELCGTGRVDIDPEFSSEQPLLAYRELLYARICGQVSPYAMRSLVQELKGVIRSLVRSSLVATEAGSSKGTSWDTPTGFPIVSLEELRCETSFIRLCLQSYFAKPKSKGNSFDRRIHNAVTLLVEADAQQTDAMGIALSVTAIEALLASGKTEVTANICDRMASILEPDPQYRSAANEFMKKAYNDRSIVLHGDKLDAENHRREEIRLLAASILYSLVSFDAIRSQSPAEFFDELKKGKYSTGQPLGVAELPHIRNYWNATTR